jgi:NAD(P)-dependent dehydrogenase (short-subunit alcohol dehydrogenase family)
MIQANSKRTFLTTRISLTSTFTQAEDISKARQTIGKIIGDDGLYGLVNNAGIAVTGPIEALPMEAIRQQFEVNFFGHVAVTQALLPAIRQAKGRIVNITSILGRVTVPFSAPYCASKYAMEAYSDSLRMELMPDGIEVIIIEPTIIGTNIWTKQQTWQDEMMSELPPQQQAKYENRLKILRTTTDEQASLGESPDIIADTIQHAMTSKRPKARYTVGVKPTRFYFWRNLCHHVGATRFSCDVCTCGVSNDTRSITYCFHQWCHFGHWLSGQQKR